MRLFLLSAVGFLLVTVACEKYQDGPNFSLRSKEARLANTWIVQSAYNSEFTDNPESGTNEVALWEDFVLTFQRNGDYDILNQSPDLSVRTEENGTWTFEDDGLKVITKGVRQTIDASSGNVTSEESRTTTWRINRLKNNELWIWYQNAPTPPWIYFRMTSR